MELVAARAEAAGVDEAARANEVLPRAKEAGKVKALAAAAAAAVARAVAGEAVEHVA